MRCPYCNYIESKVVDTRPTDEYRTIRRRRECNNCNRRFTSYERIEEVPVLVVKKDKTIQSYDRSKILNGIIKACEKRPVPLEKMEKLVDQIERKIYNSLDKEISSTEIGEMVMDELKALDEVAYVRFASVYRQFKDIQSFMEELEFFMKEREKDA